MGKRDIAEGHFQMVAMVGGEVKSSHQWESVIRRVSLEENCSS